MRDFTDKNDVIITQELTLTYVKKCTHEFTCPQLNVLDKV